MQQEAPKKILDLGIGKGSLTKAAFTKWGKAKYFAIDVDLKRIKDIIIDLPFVNVKKVNGLKANFESLKQSIGLVDLAICNPPYLKVKRGNYKELFNQAGLPACNSLKYLTSDLIFLAQNLRLLKVGGELGIILPDGLLTNHDFSLFRNDLLINHTLTKVIQLPDNVFQKTEARTHILIIKKGKPKGPKIRKVMLSQVNFDGKELKPIKVYTKELVHRMDYMYQYYKSKHLAPKLCLKDINAVIKRGKYDSKFLSASRLSYFHSTHFKKHGNQIVVENKAGIKHIDYCAKAGDILLCRVGKRIAGSSAIVKKGRFIISDCVYKISVTPKYRNTVFKSLKSSSGKEWLKVHAHGVCSQVISKSDLLNFPVDLK